MNWYYVDNGRPAGPVSQEQFDVLCSSGKVSDQTLVWREGMPDWKPCGTIRAAGTPPAGGSVNREALLAHDYEHDIGGYFRQAWQLYRRGFGAILGATLLVFLCIFAANAVPYLSIILSIVFTGPLMGGLWLFYLRRMRGQETVVGDAFSGFGPRFGQLLLGNFIPGLLAGLCVMPVALIAGFSAALIIPAMSAGRGAPSAGLLVTLIVFGGGFLIIAVCAAIYLQVCWLYTLGLVADKHLEFWPAMSLSRRMVIKHWWMNFLVVLVAGLFVTVCLLPGTIPLVIGVIMLVNDQVAGLLPLAAGVFVLFAGWCLAQPVALGMKFYAYEKIFGDLSPRG